MVTLEDSRRRARPSGSRCRSVAALAIAALLLLPPPLHGQGAVEEYQLKAAFLYNFARYVNWPEQSLDVDAPFVFGVLGDDPFGQWLDEAIDGGQIHGRKAVARRYRRLEEAIEARVLYIGLRDRAALERALSVLGKAPVLTVGESDAFLDAGGIIQLNTDGRRVRFDINLPAARRAELNPSSQLLKLARTVRGGPNVR